MKIQNKNLKKSFKLFEIEKVCRNLLKAFHLNESMLVTSEKRLFVPNQARRGNKERVKKNEGNVITHHAKWILKLFLG